MYGGFDAEKIKKILQGYLFLYLHHGFLVQVFVLVVEEAFSLFTSSFVKQIITQGYIYTTSDRYFQHDSGDF